MEIIAGSLLAALLILTVAHTLFSTSGNSMFISAEVLRSLVIICIALISIIIALAFVISRYILSPIRKLSKSVQNINIEKPSLDIDASLRRARGEIGDLVASFTCMIEDLATYQQKARENASKLGQELYISEQRENKLQEQKDASEEMNKALQKIWTCETDEELVHIFLGMAEELTNSKFGFVIEVNDAGDFGVVGCDNLQLGVTHRPHCFRFGNLTHVPVCIAQNGLLNDGKSLIIDLSLSNSDNAGASASRSAITSFLGVPLEHEGKIIGMIGLANEEPGYDLSHQVAIEALSADFVEILIRKHAETSIMEKGLRYSSLIEATTPVVWSTDAEERLVALRVPWDVYTGQTGEDQSDWGWLQAIHPEDREKVMEIWTQADIDREVDEPVGQIWCDATGQYHSFIMGSTPRHSGRSIADTNVGKLTGGLAQKAEALARSNAELEQFAYVASHDLQEPLRKIQAFTNRLVSKHKQALDEQGNDYLDRVQNAAHRMQTLINDLLTFSRVTTKAQPFISVDLAKVAQGVVSDLEVRIERTNGRVEVGDLPTINADPLQMRQLLQNLIANGLKFHKEDESPVVKLYAKSVNGTCQIFVQDDGIGFDEKYLDRIFTIFQRLHGRLEYEGTGIGLAVCRKIVERHGGSITAKGAPGHGATFIATLPTHQPKGDSHNENNE